MSKSLSILQTIAKVVKIVAKVLFILCIIGGVGSLLGLISVLALGPFLEELGESVAETSALGCFVGLISCIGEAIFFRMTERYCAHELEAGTPFTKEGAKEIRRLGIASLIISVSITFVCVFAEAIFYILVTGASDVDVSSSFSLGTCLFLLLLSVIFQYGAEAREEAQAPKIEWEPVWETPVKEEPKAASAPAEEKPAEPVTATTTAEATEQEPTQNFDVL